MGRKVGRDENGRNGIGQTGKTPCLLVSEKKIFKDFANFFLLVAMATKVMGGIQSLE